VRWVHGGIQVGPTTVLPGVAVLLLALDAAVGLDATAWVAGGLVATVTWVLVTAGMRREGLTRLGPANRVTLLRAGLVAGVTALVVRSWDAEVPHGLLVGLASVALVLDLVDGRLARARESVTRLGAAFDMETDAWLILVLSAYAVPLVGPWVLLIGLARYLLLAAALVRPWLNRPTPSRRWAQVVAAVQGIVLVVVAAELLPGRAAQGAALLALVLLAESFGHQLVHLWQHRRDAAVARPRWLRPLVDTVAVAVVWAALLLPHRPDQVGRDTWIAIPVELLVFVTLAIVLPAVLGRLLALVGGLLLAAGVLLAVLDLGFYEAFDRPFDLLSDPSYASSGLDLLHRTLGRGGQVGAVSALAVLVLTAVTGCVWAALRVRRAARSAPRAWARGVAVLAVVWTIAGIGGAQVGGVPVAAAPGAALVRSQVDQVRADLRDRAVFEHAQTHDRYALTPGRHLLRALHGKDVLVVFVESYGRVAVDDSWFAPKVDATLGRATSRLAQRGFFSRSGWLRSPTFGGISWLAHSTLQTGLWIDSQQRYDQVLAGERLTLTQAFHRAGWRTVGDVPSDLAGWPEGRRFYHYDQLYNANNVGYHGRRFSYAQVPDQFTLRAFTQRELKVPGRGPVMGEIDLVSSHTPWTPLPHIVPWRNLGDGAVFDSMHSANPSLFGLVGGGARKQLDYARSIRYSLNSLVSFVRHAHDRKLVMVVLGDHQPNSVVSGTGASHDVPVSLVAHDPDVLARIGDWGWTAGLQPASDAPVMPMDGFRDRFLAAFGSRPMTPRPPTTP
jgi:phosphatidylglycerophosphate synthase